MEEGRKPNGMLKDSAGNVSSKRIIGLAAFLVATVLAIMNRESQLVWPFISLSGAILGVSVLERR
jgi:hypothetical protein